MAPDWDRYDALLRSSLGIDADEAPPDFRAIYQPTFSVDCCVTLRGAELTFTWLAAGVRSYLMALAGVRGVGNANGLPPEPERFEERAEIPPPRLADFHEAMSALGPGSLADALHGARDGIALIGQCGAHWFRASSPTPAEAPRHHTFFVEIERLASSLLPGRPPLAAVRRHL
jgi:hypothetical protein